MTADERRCRISYLYVELTLRVDDSVISRAKILRFVRGSLKKAQLEDYQKRLVLKYR
jgi:hypothetical protein